MKFRSSQNQDSVCTVKYFSRAFGQLGGHCANSDSRWIKWGTLSSLHEVSNPLCLFWSAMVLYSGMYPGCLPFGDSLFFPSPPLTYSSPHVSFYLHYNVTTWPICDLQLHVYMLTFCLEPIIPPRHNFCFPVWEISYPVVLVTWLQHNTVLKGDSS